MVVIFHRMYAEQIFLIFGFFILVVGSFLHSRRGWIFSAEDGVLLHLIAFILFASFCYNVICSTIY